MDNNINNVEEGAGCLALEQSNLEQSNISEVEADPDIISEEKDGEMPVLADLVEPPVMIKKGKEYQSTQP